jgi:putative spermidine/putrescine transport system ATP-binding protein
MIAGFIDPSAGEILLDGAPIGGLPAHRRDMGLVFQSYALFPHLSVARNVAFGLEMRRQKRAAIAARVDEMLRLVKLEPFAERLPRQLSGGQQQRVALARALAIHPRVLLLDEPLSNLDAALRGEVARDIRILQREAGLTAIMVTHDQDEAMAMADRLVVMREGRVEQIGTQEDLYERPQTPFVAGFIGRSNIIAGALHDRARLVPPGGAPIVLAGHYGGDGAATLAVRPERIAIAAASDAARARGVVELSTYLGAVVEHVVRLSPELRVVMRAAAPAPRFPPGAEVALHWAADAERVFDEAGAPLDAAAPVRLTA